jgi:preprotein translocase subunit SecG
MNIVAGVIVVALFIGIVVYVLKQKGISSSSSGGGSSSTPNSKPVNKA